MGIPKAGSLGKASNWSTVFPVDTDAYTTYVPTWTQSATVTKTVSRAAYTKVGRNVKGDVVMVATGAGTAANTLLFGLPVPAAFGGNTVIGECYLYDTSAGIFYTGPLVINSTTTCKFVITGSTIYAGAAGFTAAIAAGDQVSFDFDYEAAS